MIALPYEAGHRDVWNAFARAARNAHFFFDRDYMEYHRDRFLDASLLVYEAGGRLLALFPATRAGDVVTSHGGLTFGGFLTGRRMTARRMLAAMETVVSFYRHCGATMLVYKRMPYIYATYPNEEDLYALFRMGAELYRRDLSATICLGEPIPYTKGHKSEVKAARKAGVVVSACAAYDAYFELLSETLLRHHGVRPVHTAEEMKRLAARFPENIRLVAASREGRMLAGALLFRAGRVVHTQYLANSEEGRRCGALAAAIDFAIREEAKGAAYFDFGISNEQEGRVLSEGLARQKEGFGARGIAHDFYRIVL